MEDLLLGLVLDRLDASELEPEAQLFVLAACQGDNELDQALGGSSVPRPDVPQPQDDGPDVEPPGASIASVTVEGFRGIGPAATLTFAPGPGLTLVIGRNGSGKSSFAEALEVLLTGDNDRWAARSKVWKDGWRNLHHDERLRITSSFFVEGKGSTTVVRTWDADLKITEGEATAQTEGKSRGALDTLGWGDPLSSYRPFLSYNELGSLLEGGPTGLYDALAAILGLDEITDAVGRLSAVRLGRDRLRKSAKDRLKVIVPELEGSADERAAACLAAVSGTSWDLDAVGSIVVASPEAEETPGLDAVRTLASLESPVTAERAVELASTLRQASVDQAAVADTAAAKAHDAAAILEQARSFHDHHGDGDCPVCGAPAALSAAWHQEASARGENLRQLAAEASAANDAARTARAEAQRVFTSTPAALTNAPPELDAVRVAGLWDAWSEGTEDATLEQLAGRLEGNAADLIDAVDALRAQAKDLQELAEDAWRPLAMMLASWLEEARALEDGAAMAIEVRAAEDWLKELGQDVRAERFEPIADQAKRIWNVLRMQSNVELADVTLEGSAAQRKVNVSVNVDGVESAALGVMSQGELHALALSLFFPRATLPESPFRFVVVDDPVQSMDPSRVDGLARVLEWIAKTRQVIVFTHDDRLPQSVRALGIDATVMEVLRRSDSVVEVRTALDPVSRYLDDARALAKTDNLPTEVAKRTVPGFCRLALEAAFTQSYRWHALHEGEMHADIEAVIADADTTNKKAALGLFGDLAQTGQVMTKVNTLGRGAGDAYRACKEGAHESYGGDLMALIKDTERLTTAILVGNR